jgi:hypothetical protein
MFLLIWLKSTRVAPFCSKRPHLLILAQIERNVQKEAKVNILFKTDKREPNDGFLLFQSKEGKENKLSFNNALCSGEITALT